MTTPILLVATGAQSIGAARMPHDLANAGFEVALLTPQDSVAEKSRFLSKVGHLPDNATPLQWVYAFAAIVKAAAPRLVLPCDDTAFRWMQLLALSPPEQLQPALQSELASLIKASLGDPAFYRTSVDKTLLYPAAEALGVRVPPYAMAADAADAQRFAAERGYPVVLKRSQSTAGGGVAIVADRDELARELAQFLRPEASQLGDAGGGRVMVQAYIPGSIHYCTAAAWKGSLIASLAVDKLAGAPAGPACVVRCFRSPTLRDCAEKLVRGFGVTGMCSPEFVVHEGNGETFLLDMNRRTTQGTHRGGLLDADLSAALYAALNGTVSTSRAELDEGEERIYADFPLELMRDPNSQNLRDYPVDVPWEEPELIEAMVALTRTQ
jgi:hypothetical protein